MNERQTRPRRRPLLALVQDEVPEALRLLAPLAEKVSVETLDTGSPCIDAVFPGGAVWTFTSLRGVEAYALDPLFPVRDHKRAA